jgi:hypothetical protein
MNEICEVVLISELRSSYSLQGIFFKMYFACLFQLQVNPSLTTP